jgi:methylated-DNA-[protein]-cysteine S-methyltransferase
MIMTTPSLETTIRHTTMASTLGELTLVRDADRIRGLYFPHHWHTPDTTSFGPPSDADFAETIAQIEQYLAGTLREFDLPLTPRGDVFQCRVWDHVQQIPYGETITYGELATRVGEGTTAQQVGAAVGRNPLCILIPCHRVVGSGGKLTGYAGGIARKRHLLELERQQVAVAERTPRARHRRRSGHRDGGRRQQGAADRAGS